MASDSSRNSQLNQAAPLLKCAERGVSAEATVAEDSVLAESVSSLADAIEFLALIILALALLMFTYARDDKRAASESPVISAVTSSSCMEVSPAKVESEPKASRPDHSSEMTPAKQ